jgi:curved DNA-binding protein CbpA
MAETSPDNYYNILGVASDATDEEIETAYFDLARTLHPDVAGGGSEASAHFMKINEAFQTLSDPELRREYDESLAVPGGITAGSTGTATVTAGDERGGMQAMSKTLKRAVRTAERLISEGDFWHATELLNRLLKDYERQPSLRRTLAKAAAGRQRFREAAEHLKVACEVEYFNADNHAALGRMYMKGQQWSRAMDCFRDALSWNDEHKDAREGIEAIEAELNKGKSFFRKLPGLIRGKLKI